MTEVKVDKVSYDKGLRDGAQAIIDAFTADPQMTTFDTQMMLIAIANSAQGRLDAVK